MQSTLTSDATDPHDIFVIEPDVVLAARADRPVAEAPVADSPSQDRILHALASQSAASPARPSSNLAEAILGDILSKPSTPSASSPKPPAPNSSTSVPRVAPEISVAAPGQSPPRVDATFRATAASADVIASAIKAPNEIKVPDDIRLNGPRPGRGAWAKRASVAFLFALCSVVAAKGWDSYGDTARQMMAQWTPALAQLLPSSQPATTTAAATTPAAPADQPALPVAQAAVPPAQTAIADQTTSPPAPAAVQPAQDTPAATAAAAPSAQQLQSVTQDVAAMGQQIEALKATIAQLKAGQEQMAQQISRDVVRNAVVRNSEPKAAEPRHVSTQPPRPVPARKPVRATYYAPAPAASAMNMPPPPRYPAPPPVAAPPPMQSMGAVAPDGDPVVRPPMPLH
ncbi:MAG TPA: hypothetical protein VHU87_04345 [Rhizomicrobium sp.]|nr:hypothetical protein [Rhizomicrobium sp.]